MAGDAYPGKIEREARYWGEFERQANLRGVPWWCDLRRATRLPGFVAGWMGDPRSEHILRGECKRRLIAAASRVKGDCLDLGCGAGWLSLELARAGMRVDGFDVSAQRLEIARSYLGSELSGVGTGQVRYEARDLNSVELEPGKYISVVSWDTLHHIVSIERLVQEVRRSLVAGGSFVVFDHVGLGTANRRLARLAGLPFALSRRLSRKGAERAPEPGVSAFEDVTGKEMVGIIGRYFRITELSYHLCLAGALAGDLAALPDAVRYPLLSFYKAVDAFLAVTGLLRGEYVFIRAEKS